MEGLNKENNTELNKEKLISKDFFNFQVEAARELLNKYKKEGDGRSIKDVLYNFTPIIRDNVFDFEDQEQDLVKNFEPGITEENIVDKAYENYSKKEKNRREHVANNPEIPLNRRFGPISYVVPENNNEGYETGMEDEAGEDNVTFHFSNDYNMNPKQLLNIEERKRDIKNMLGEIKSKYPNIKTISTASWLLDAIPNSISEKLFPQSFINSMKVKDAKTGWRMGTMIWGQFLDVNGNLKKDLADELIKNIRNLKENEYLIDLLKPPLYKPKSSMCDIDDFYKMYNV